MERPQQKNALSRRVPVTMAAVIAVVGAVTLYLMDFGPKNEVQRGAINMITAASVDRAGATALPTRPTTQPAASVQNSSSSHR